MTEVEEKIYTSLKEVNRLLVPMTYTVEDDRVMREAMLVVTSLFEKIVGHRIIKEGRDK